MTIRFDPRSLARYGAGEAVICNTCGGSTSFAPVANAGNSIRRHGVGLVAPLGPTDWTGMGDLTQQAGWEARAAYRTGGGDAELRVEHRCPDCAP